MLLGFLNISYAWHGNLAGQVAFPVAVLHFSFFFLGGKDIHYTSAMIATSRVCFFFFFFWEGKIFITQVQR